MEALLIPLLNHMLSQQGWARTRLSAHAGRQAALLVAGQRLRLRIDEGGLLVKSDADSGDDVEIEVGSDAFRSIPGGMDGLMAHVRITGNAELADALSFVARHLRWDREADLARLFGPILGRRMHLAAGGVERAVPDAGKRLALNATEYLVHEGGLLVAQAEMEAHMTEIRRFRDDLARLEQRVERLSRMTR